MFKRADICCFVGGAALFVYGVYQGLLGIEMAHDGVSVQGVVARNDPDDVIGTGQNKPVYSIVQFTDQAGVTHEVRTLTGSYPPHFAVGEKVDVFHRKGKPESARIADFENLYGGAIIASFVSNVIFLIGAIILGVESLGKRWRQRRAGHSTGSA